MNTIEKKRFDSLRDFALSIMECWPHGGVDGGELQEAAITCGILVGRIVDRPCGEECQCHECGVDFPTDCYFLPDWMKHEEQQS